jgi:hypothetical protein
VEVLKEHLKTEAGKVELMSQKALLRMKHMAEKKARLSLSREEQKRAQVRSVCCQ